MLHGHGGDVYSVAQEIGIRPEKVLDFSSNCSPLPYPPGLREYICGNLDQLHLLPEVDCITIRRLLAKRYGLEPDNFLIGSGTTEWIYSLPRIIKPGRALVAYPTYADYEDACRQQNIPVFSIGTFPSGSEQEEERFLDSIQSIDDRLIEKGIVFVCNPNNPTGLFVPPERLLEAIDSKPSSTTWIVDESYAPFIGADEYSSLMGRGLPDNVVLLRSFSKIYGIPGLRVGCLVSKSRAIREIGLQIRPWAVNRMAQLAMEFFLENTGFEQTVRDYCMNEKRFISGELAQLETLGYVEGKCHFAMFLLKGMKAEEITRALKQRGILIRNCNNFKGITGQYIRISPRLHADNEKLILKIKALCT